MGYINKKHEKIATDYIKLFYIKELNDDNFKSMVRFFVVFNFFFFCVPGIIGIALLFHTKVTLHFINVFVAIFSSYLISYMINGITETIIIFNKVKNILKTREEDNA